jgi:hypothetical protein
MSDAPKKPSDESSYGASDIQVLEGLGARVMVDVPECVAAYLQDSANSKDNP